MSNFQLRTSDWRSRAFLATALLLAPSSILVAGTGTPGEEEGAGTGLSVGGQGYQRIETRANVFTTSNQERAALALDAEGGGVLVWQSRRQEEGTYGVYARRLAPDGTALGGETHVNATTRGMQMLPAVALDGQDAAWFAWGSYGQDGDQGAVVVRRFDPALATATAEVIANDEVRGDQRDPAIAAFADGSAFVVWSAHETDGLTSRVEGRRFGPDGMPLGTSFRIDQGGISRNELPVIVGDPEGAVVVAWARASEQGVPTGIHVRRYGPDGAALGDEMAVDGSELEGDASALGLDLSSARMPIEPALTRLAGGGFAVAWMENAKDGHVIRLRRVREIDGEIVAGRIEPIEVSGPGYTSGLALDANERGEILVSWSRHGDGEELQPGLFARVAGVESGAGEAFRVTARSEGGQKLAAASGAQRVRFLDDGRMAFAWSGDGALGDTSGAHLTLLVPEGLAIAPSRPMESDSALTFADPEAGAAAPHEPPTFDPLDRQPPQTDIDQGPIAGGDFSFLAVTSTGWTPPDPHMAVGPGHVVVMTNGQIAFFDKAGTNLFRDEIENSFGFWGAQGATNFVFDPEVIYDPYTDRFMAMACERSSSGAQHGYYLLAISDDSDPVGSWFKYRIDATPSAAGATDIDSPNIAVDQNVIYLSADFFTPTSKLHVMMVDKSTVINGGTPVSTALIITGDQSQGFPVTYDSTAPAQYMIGFKFGTATSVKMYAIQNALTVPVLTSIDVTVPSYSSPEDPPQMGTGTRPETFEARFWSAVYRNGRLWATHHVNSSRLRQRWYEFDMANWPVSGTPTLVQSGEVDLGGTIRTFFGSLWVDASGNMGLVYARSSPSEFLSMERTWRAAGDPPGTTRTPVQIIASTSADTTGRWGDYSSTSDDPADPGHFWGHHEYRTSGWLTRVGRWSICDGSVVNYCLTSPNSVGPGAIMGHSGSTSIAANDFGLFSSGCPANQFGLFYYGATQGQSVFGNGFKCVNGQLFRLPPLQIDALGIATQPIDYNNLPAGGQILAGSTWNFQFWYRDPAGGGALFNLSDGLSASYCP